MLFHSATGNVLTTGGTAFSAIPAFSRLPRKSSYIWFFPGLVSAALRKDTSMKVAVRPSRNFRYAGEKRPWSSQPKAQSVSLPVEGGFG